ncbi:phosphoglycerate kinase, partial [Candidatus Pacebacteria bacterium]|nr:phosphoglycerate kinase [Candidatus Paceibacterota bacterium]
VITDTDDWSGKRVFLRAALNVPVQNGSVQNDFRLKQSLETITWLTSRGAKVILASHIGRDPEESLAPVYAVLKEIVPMEFSAEVLGERTKRMVADMEDGDVVLIENLRQHQGEKNNDPALAELLADLADVYVDDDFTTAHRAHASIVGVPAHLPAYAGLTFAREYTELGKARTPESPALFLLGGAKFDTKLPLVEKYLDIYDHVFVGGALANDFFKAKGFEVGASLVSDIDLSDSALLEHPKLVLPIDVVAEYDGQRRVSAPDHVEPHERILDAGPATAAMLQEHIAAAKMILWNGPFGDYEHGFAEQTLATAGAIAAAEAYSVIGGGDTVAAIEELQISEQIDFLSTAGGAMLQFLEHGSLPGIDAIVSSHG